MALWIPSLPTANLLGMEDHRLQTLRAPDSYSPLLPCHLDSVDHHKPNSPNPIKEMHTQHTPRVRHTVLRLLPTFHLPTPLSDQCSSYRCFNAAESVALICFLLQCQHFPVSSLYSLTLRQWYSNSNSATMPRPTIPSKPACCTTH